MIAYRTILVPYDFSEHADEALEVALDLAEPLAGELHLLHVVRRSIATDPEGEVESGAEAGAGAGAEEVTPARRVRNALCSALHDVAAEAARRAERPITSRVVDATSITDCIRVVALELPADLIVMGTQGRSGAAEIGLGSVAEGTLRHAPCPVVTARAGSSDPLALASAGWATEAEDDEEEKPTRVAASSERFIRI